MNRLILKYRHDKSYFDKSLDRDDFGRLTLRVETEAFAGEGGFWVQWQDVVEFGQSMNAFPIQPDNPIVRQWGYEMQEGDDVIIRISIGPKNTTGDLLVSVVVADDHDQSQRLTVSFRSGYPALDTFREDIARMMKREITQAVLKGH